MILLASIIKKFVEKFSHQYHPLPSHKQALRAMEQCRKQLSPYMVAQCTNDSCREHLYVPHSCGHRSCPHCQSHESRQWIDNQLDKQLPGQYFLITFTLPRQLHDLAWKNQRLVYSILFSAVQELLKTFTRNDKKMGGAAGFTAVLHTHSRRLEFHPHIHVVMPGMSINQKDRLWKRKSGKYLFNHKAMAKVFRAKILKAIAAHHLPIPANTPGKWVVDCKNVGKGNKALIYLGKYLYKGVIQERDILKNENGMVTFRYFNSKTKKYQNRTVTGEYFLYLLMLHILPKGFRRTRCYGFLHPGSKKLIKLLQLVLRINPFRMTKEIKERPKITCPACGAAMRIVKTRIPADWRPAHCLT